MLKARNGTPGKVSRRPRRSFMLRMRCRGEARKQRHHVPCENMYRSPEAWGRFKECNSPIVAEKFEAAIPWWWVRVGRLDDATLLLLFKQEKQNGKKGLKTGVQMRSCTNHCRDNMCGWITTRISFLRPKRFLHSQQVSKWLTFGVPGIISCTEGSIW